MNIAQFAKQVIGRSATTLILSVAAFVLVLVITLDMMAAILIFILFLFLAIFQQSFSRGWLFLFIILLLLPSIRIGDEVTVRDVFTVMLAIVGLVTITVESRRLPINRLGFLFLLLILVAGAFVAFGNFFGQVIDSNVWVLLITFILIWSLLLTFQYLFQTQKRLRRFFVALVSVGVLHSVFGLVAYFFGFQTASGMGVTIGKFQHLIFRNANFQINGFLGDGSVMRVGNSALAPLLLVTLSVTVGIFLTARNKKKALREKIVRSKTKRRFFDSIKVSRDLSKVINLKKVGELSEDMPFVFSKKGLILIVFLIQLTALFLTFSYESLVILVVGLFVMGILLRKKMLLSLSASLLIILVVAFPGFRTSLVSASEENFSLWFSGFEQVKQSPWWGNGWRLAETPGTSFSTSQDIHNSYLFIWNNFGIIGLLVFLIALIQYFLEIRDAYLKSDGWPRIWLVVSLSIFIQLVLFGVMSNGLIFGPAGLVFWLFYGVVQNLRKKIIQFGITETRLF